MTRNMLYVALNGGGSSSQVFDSTDETVEAVGELVRLMNGHGEQMVTFTVANLDGYSDSEVEEVLGKTAGDKHAKDCPAHDFEGRECTCNGPEDE